jgi:hypothetical protein
VFVVDKFCHFFQPKNCEFFGFFFFLGSVNMIISLSFWKGSPNFYIKTIGPKKTPLVGRCLVKHQIHTRGVF